MEKFVLSLLLTAVRLMSLMLFRVWKALRHCFTWKTLFGISHVDTVLGEHGTVRVWSTIFLRINNVIHFPDLCDVLGNGSLQVAEGVFLLVVSSSTLECGV